MLTADEGYCEGFAGRSHVATGKTGRWRALLGVLMVGVLTGCAAPQIISYTGRSYIPVSGPAAETPDVDTEVRTVPDMDPASVNMFKKGYALVGYSQFVSPLAPLLANANARATAEANGATVALRIPARNASFRQHYFLMTYWRPASADEFVLGAYYADPEPELVGELGCNEHFSFVTAVVPGTPAAKAGLQADDILLSVNGDLVNSAADMDKQLALNAGKNVGLEFIRNGKVIQRSVHLNAPAKRAAADTKNIDKEARQYGISIDELQLTEEEVQRYDAQKGFYVRGVQYGMPGCDADLRTGDMIVAVNGENIKSAKQFNKLLDNDDANRLTVRRGREVSDKVLPARRPLPSRPAIMEATFGQPWKQTEASDWSLLAGSLQAAQIMLNASQQYTAAKADIAKEQRAALYRRAQALEAAKPRVIEGRGKTLWALDDRGVYRQVSREMVSAMNKHPGSRVTTKRGNRAMLVDSMGKRIITEVQAPRVYKPAPFRPVAWKGDYRQELQDALMNSLNYNKAMRASMKEFSLKRACHFDTACDWSTLKGPPSGPNAHDYLSN